MLDGRRADPLVWKSCELDDYMFETINQVKTDVKPRRIAQLLLCYNSTERDERQRGYVIDCTG